ncbi:MAG: outer membrane beta-barrel protein [Verrucomicrobiota bacterium]
MKTKKRLTVSLSSIAIGCSGVSFTHAQGIGNAVDLYAGVSGAVEYTDNVFLNSNEDSDTIFYLSPFVGIARDKGLVSLDGTAGVNFQKYVDFDDNDSANLFANLSGAYAGKPLSASGSIGYTQETQASGAVGTILETGNFNVNGSLKYYISDISGVSASAGYATSVSDTSGFGDTETFTVGGGGFYDYSEALSFDLGVRYRRTEVSDVNQAANDSDDIALIGGVTGDLTPTLVGNLQAGVQQRSFDNANEDDQVRPFFGAGLTWTIDSLTSVSLTGKYDYTTTVSNLSQESLILTGTLNHSFTNQLSGNVGLSFEDDNFVSTVPGQEDRDDTQWEVFGGASYQLTDWGTVGVQLSYADRDSNEDFFTYDVFSATLSASASF